MNILAINSAFSETNVALLNGEQKTSKSLLSSAKQSENLLDCLDSLLKDSQISIKDIDYIGIVVGPGSFTGLRIGIALVKGFLQVFPNIKVVAINSLELMAYQYIQTAKKNEDFWCIINALSGNLFVAKYDKTGIELLPPKMWEENDISQINGCVIGLKNESLEMANQLLTFNTECLLDLAIKKVNEKQFTLHNQLSPLYLRLSQAEFNLKKVDK